MIKIKDKLIYFYKEKDRILLKKMNIFQVNVDFTSAIWYNN